MTFEELETEIAILMQQMEDQPANAHDVYLIVREKLNEMKAFGMPLPADLLELEKRLEQQFDEEAGA